MAPGENKFDTPDLGDLITQKNDIFSTKFINVHIKHDF